MTNIDLYNSLMKNLIYILLGAGFLAIVSSSASGFLTTETSNTLDNLYEETFYIDPENIEITNENVVITLSQQNKNKADKKINDCLNYYKKVYEDLDINCNLVVKESVALNSSCVHKSGVYVKEDNQDYIKITTYSNC